MQKNSTRTNLATRQNGMRTESKPKSLLVEYAELRYDYAQVASGHRRAVQDAAVDINRKQRRAREDMLAVGRRFIEVKEMLPYGQFLDWLDAEFELSDRMARHQMEVSHAFADSELWKRVSKLSDGAIYLLASPSTPQSAREGVARLIDETGKAPTRAQVQEIITSERRLLAAPIPKMIEMQTATPAVTLETRFQSDKPARTLQSGDWETAALPDGRWYAKAWPKNLWATDRFDDATEAMAAALRGEHSEEWYRQWLDFGYLCYCSTRDPVFQTARERAPLWLLRESLEICQHRQATKGVIEALGARIRKLEREEAKVGVVQPAPAPATIDAQYAIVEESPTDEELAAIAIVEAERAEEDAERAARDEARSAYERVPEPPATLTFDEWWGMMPHEEMGLEHWLTIFKTAQAGVGYVRTLDVSLTKSVLDIVVPWSKFIHAIEEVVEDESHPLA